MDSLAAVHATLGLSPVHGEFFLNQKKSTRPRFGARRGPHHSTPPPVSEGRLGSSGLEENKKGGVPSASASSRCVALHVSRLHRPPHRTAPPAPCLCLPVFLSLPEPPPSHRSPVLRCFFSLRGLALAIRRFRPRPRSCSPRALWRPR
jgi:hypothetical protein